MLASYDIRPGASFAYNDDTKQNGGHHYGKNGIGQTRELPAKTYLANTDMSAEDIAFLLGYREIGSFLRAFTAWTGRTVGEYRK